MLLTLHIIVVILAAISVFLADRTALQWLRGKREVNDPSLIRSHHVRVSILLGLLLLTGGMLYAEAPIAFLSYPLFDAKMGVVLALILNSAAVGNMGTLSTKRSFASLTTVERYKVYVVGAVSSLGWIAAPILGILLAN